MKFEEAASPDEILSVPESQCAIATSAVGHKDGHPVGT